MGRLTSKRLGAVWRTEPLLAAAVVVAVLALHLGTDAIATLERRFFDFASTLRDRTPSDRVAIIAIDDASLAAMGRWPWPRDVHARLIDQLAAGGAKVVVHTSLFVEPQADRGLAYVQRLKRLLPPAPGTEIAALLAQAERALDPDAVLADSLARSGQVLLPAVLTLGEPLGRPDRPLPAWATRSALPPAPGHMPAARDALVPIEPIGAAAAGIGHLNHLTDVDGAVRELPLLLDFDGRAVPSIALLAVARALNLQPADIRLGPGQDIRLGGLRIPTDEQARVLPQFYAGTGKPAFSIDAFHEVASGRIDASRYAGKIVLVGATAAGVGSFFAVPGHPALAPVEMLAHITSSLLQADSMVQPAWAGWVATLLVGLVALYLLALLGRLSARQGAWATGLLFAGLLGAELLLLTRSATWVPMMLPATLLLAGHLALTTRRFLQTEAGKRRADDETAEAHRMMGLALQGQGQLDMAFDRFRRVPLGEAVMDNLYSLALDFERKRQYNKAEAIYRHMAGWDASYKDLPSRLARAQRLADTVMLSGGGETAATLALGGEGVERPMLGRYQLEKELGKGAMGVVYLGRDPRIGRAVAIKTLALGKEFAGPELDEIRERFFREAETAGRLAHPDIVTIYDAGEEHDLAYIAMELLQGHDLTRHCDPQQLLPARTVLSIAARVAEALAYAHAQGVVHRDVKPGNIMYEPRSDQVKVTDFGIARVMDASRTRTGTLLGTPNYMSPEQLAGLPVAGSSDLYSLGVALYQLLTGRLPFEGDSLAAVMYAVAHHPAPDLREHAPSMPQPLAELVARALAKHPEARLPDGLVFAAELRACVALLAPAAPAASAPQAGA
ncbi:CHASE2 domain-containing serine/threonine-protein kinase [Ramlibacter rhizophilus]|uniref:CHASE2 domain-containing serine/threonine-protein kinase n=1 Tax=Ramlibacter rhizophilus TaxID=1781167 RepID=UPI001F103F17|nr:serine/threonine-protein kinase [Ramlibacter rhizophilus]